MIEKDIVIVGGGAAGFFAAVNIAKLAPSLSVAILERGQTGLAKVKVSGGGRCNVTHAEFIPSELVHNYPRGERELLGPFHQFMTGDTMAWFEERGVPLNIEEDGRIFPASNSSQSIINCFLREAEKYKVDIKYSHGVQAIEVQDNGFKLNTSKGDIKAKRVLIATGSNNKMWQLLETLGHKRVDAVPSLFTFKINDSRIKDIPGVVAENVEIKIKGTSLETQGPLLITHWGMSAPAVLKLSAFGALEIAKRDYKFTIEVNFIRESFNDCLNALKQLKQSEAKKSVYKGAQFNLPKRLWHKLVLAANIFEETRWGDVNKAQIENLAKQLSCAEFNVNGKTTFKEEFVTAGGVALKEVNFKTFESKRVPGLYFAGEVLNIDAITGGFNFQNAWTGAYIASQNITQGLQ